MYHKVFMVLALCLCVVAMAQEQEQETIAPAAPAAAAPATAAPAAAEPAAEEQLPPEITQNVEMFMQMGMDRGKATLLSAMMSDEIDPMKLMMLMMVMGGGNNMDGDAMGFFLFSNLMSQGGKSKDMPWFREGDWLYLIDDGVLYKINTETMKVDTSLKYTAKTGGVDIMKLFLQPMMGQARGKALQTQCTSNMKQLGLGLAMYVNDHDNALPGEEWAKELFPYVNNAQVYKCPARPETEVAYALNEKLLGANLEDIPNPSQVVALFESDLGGESPIGNAADIPDEGFHNGGVVLGYVDGHVKWVAVPEARRELDIEPFE